jgi:nicotinic acid mononucleotide adenylyltransferase
MLKLALNEAKEAELVLVPTKQNPLKDSPGAALNLIQAWFEDLGDSLSYQEFSRCRLETLEMLSKEEKNYTVDTLKELISSNEKWALLLGSDTASHFLKWKNPKKLLQLVKELWIVPRGEHKNVEIEKILRSIDSHIQIKFLAPVTDISSTLIRNGTLSQPLSDFLGPRVLSVWKQLGY